MVSAAGELSWPTVGAAWGFSTITTLLILFITIVIHEKCKRRGSKGAGEQTEALNREYNPLNLVSPMQEILDSEFFNPVHVDCREHKTYLISCPKMRQIFNSELLNCQYNCEHI